ncbi:MAG: OmpA family protein, partial [Rhodobacterales bacterium]|nr:OmpA family protein [Rhodobacterales bacterium]
MRASPLLIALTAFALAAGLAVLAATWIAGGVERRTAEQVRARMLLDGLDWVAVRADGLEVHLTGLAPSEAQRFRALNAAGRIVDSDRLRDGIDVTPAAAIVPPRFSVELLRNDEGISLIGLVPAEMGRAALAERVGDLADGARVTDMLEEAAFPAPADWSAAVDFGLTAAGMLPRSKISIAADRVAVTAIAGSAGEKRRLEADLTRARPAGLEVVLDISAPRPVLTPFTFRAVHDADGLRLDACSADTEAARDRILAAARAAGLTGEAPCTIGLGVPTPRWAEGVAAGLRALAVLPEASLTFSDADVTLLAAASVPQAVFDRAVGELQADLPDVFSLKATLEPRPQQVAAEGPVEFTATLSAEGRIELRGRLTDEAQRQAVASFARARFGSGAVYVATRLDPDLPDGWPVRVLAGLEAMARLAEGSLVVRPDTVQLRGKTGLPDAQAEIARILSDQLGQGQGFSVQVTYDKALDPTAALPTPAECVAALNGILAAGKIVFAPGSAEIEATAGATMQALADQLRKCPEIAMEIGGHTDSQGSEEGNLALSQARAEAVLIGLQGRRVPVSALTARGYGEGRPIADNASEEGREANRRIEFTLLTDPATADPAAPDPAAAPADAAAPAVDPD